MQVEHIRSVRGARAAAGAVETVDLGPGLAVEGVRMTFARNEEIFGEGEAADYVYYVASGSARTMRFTQDGRRQILGFHLAGDIFGLECGDAHSLSAEAVGESKILLIRRAQLDRAAAEDSAAARTLLALTSQCLATARDHALILGRKGASERVAAFLLRFARGGKSGGELDLPMSRADIADYLALTIETVSRAFSEMERQRAIALPSSRHVVMRNLAALEQLQAA